MNVLFVHYGEDRLAGSEIALLELMKCLRTKDVSPVLWCNANAMRAAAERLGIPTHQDRFEFYFDYSSPAFSVTQYVRQARRGAALIAETEAKLVHCNSAAPVQWMLPAAWRHRAPLVAYIHGAYLRRSRYVLGLHEADRIVAVSSAVAAPFLDDGIAADRVDVVPNGFDFETLGAGDRKSLRAELGIPGDAVVAAIIGSLIHLKGHDILFNALRRMVLPPNFHLLVLGDGPERARIESEAEGLPVHFLGYRSDVGAILRDNVDFIVVPSRAEAFGRVIIEAGAFGVPAIGTRVGGISEAIADNLTGLIVPPEAPGDLALAISRMIESRSLRTDLGAAAKVRATTFEINTSAARMLTNYQLAIEACDKGGRGRVLSRSHLRPYLNLVFPKSTSRPS
ncbi:MAG: glycosyltransferase family 4 protein [Alphaproteobacteria bacterium]